MPQQFIDRYGFLSDCQSAALVSRDGSIDWYCPATFDNPSVFARLLDPDAGHWSIMPVDDSTSSRRYLDDTMVLETEFATPDGTATLTDALALGRASRGHAIGLDVPHMLLRQVTGVTGTVEFKVSFYPRPEYALTYPLIQPTAQGVRVIGGPFEFYLVADCPVQINTASAEAQFTVSAGEAINFALLYGKYSDDPSTDHAIDVQAEIEDTIEGWRSWTELHGAYQGPFKEHVKRSALILQALTYQPTGAVIAAATTSVPEIIGGTWNWDYRFVWLRDLSLTLRALWIAACPDEVQRFFDWVVRALGNLAIEEQNLQIMYGIDGRRDLAEYTLDHMRGFAESAPVRIGNAAWRQTQIDVMGEVLDAIHLFRDYLGDLDNALGHLVIELANRSADAWTEPDAGMWEARDRQRHYLSSKLWCWVALDRAVKLAPQLPDDIPLQRWQSERDNIRQAILEQGWNEEVSAYTGAFGSDRLDASVLLMPLVEFLPASDERMLATIDAIERELAADGVVHRWKQEENGFLICSYWLAEALARAGEEERAIDWFERTTAYANDLGLLSEMVNVTTGDLIGNFPQAFSHIGLINAAYAIEQAAARRDP